MAAHYGLQNIFSIYLSSDLRLSPPDCRRHRQFTLVVGHRVQNDIIRMIARVVGKSFTPVVADRIGEHGAILVESGRGDAVSVSLQCLDAAAGVCVPETKGAVGTCSGESVIARMERHRIDCVDHLIFDAVVFGTAVASEGEVQPGF